MKLHKTLQSLLVCLIFATVFGGRAFAEVTQVTIARPYGMSTLPLIVIQHDGLLKKYAKENGAGDIQVKWTVVAGASQLIDAVLAGRVDFVGQGFTSFLLLWSKTGGKKLIGLGSLGSLPIILVTRESRIKSIKDFTDKDKIAVPAIKVSPQAIVLRIAAAEAFGEKHYGMLDHLTVTRSQPDGMLAVLSGKSEINSVFSTAPFEYELLEHKNIHAVLNSLDVVGPATLNIAYTTNKFRKANPKITAAFLKGLQEATAIINKNKPHAVDAYVAISGDKTDRKELLKILNNPKMDYTITPQATMKYANIMYKTGMIRIRPKSWKELFVPEIHHLPGS